MKKPDISRELTEADLVAIGCSREAAQHILRLFSEDERLDRYLNRARQMDCCALTRMSPYYPQQLRRLGQERPGCLWAKGDLVLLDRKAVALVGSRELNEDNLEFARLAGRCAAQQGYVLVSGNAKGADSQAQEACLAAGGQVISVVADSLESKPLTANVLYLSEDGFDLPFSAARALSRNRIIHCLGKGTLVAQCTLEKGGTWQGTYQNLRKGWNPVFCFDDGSAAADALAGIGATLIGKDTLNDLDLLLTEEMSFIDR